MTRITATLIFVLWSGFACAQLLKGVTDALSGGGAPVSGCSPGGPTGQMDFSVCSNIAITAAVMP